LINAITDPTKIGEEAETDGYLSIKYSFTRGDDIFRFTFFDYRGQNSGTLARGVKDNSHSDTKELNSIVFVVDLMPPERKYREDNSKALDLHVKTRLRAHVDEWSSPTLDTIFGFFDQEELRYVCLYINTVDKIRDNAAHIKSDIKEELAPMIARLRKRCGYKDDGDTLGEGFAKFDILFGSARSGLSVLKLKSELMKHSVISG